MHFPLRCQWCQRHDVGASVQPVQLLFFAMMYRSGHCLGTCQNHGADRAASVQVYEQGDFYDAAVLSIKDEDLEAVVQQAITNIACVCLAADYPTLASVPHSIVNVYKDNVLALGVMLEDYTFPLAEKAKEILANPEAFAAAAPAAGGGGGAGALSLQAWRLRLSSMLG